MGKNSEYEVQLANIADGHHEQDFEITDSFFREMENEEVTDAHIHVHLDMEKKHEAYDCLFTLSGEMQIPCDRCLDPMLHEVDAEWHIIIKYGDEYDDSADDVLVVPWAERRLDVAPLLYDTIMLTIPLSHMHAEGECNAEMAEILAKHKTGDDEEDAEAEQE